jgi:uracil-DNA glycosylase family 4
MEKRRMLELLAEKVSGCTKCQELTYCRRQTVFGEGSPDARIVFIGEAPGETEDETGRPFVGKAGQLLTNIITAMGFRRDDVFIMNIIKCRPPNNRTPEPQEASNCRPYLDLQLKIINPDYIVCLGNVAAQNLLGIDTPITYLPGLRSRKPLPLVLQRLPAKRTSEASETAGSPLG